MKTVKIQSNIGFLDVIKIILIFSVIIVVSFYLMRIFNVQSSTIFSTIKFLVLISIFIVFCFFKSMAGNSLYMSDIVFGKDEIKFIYKRKNKPENEIIIKKDDIKEFNLYVKSDLIYIGCSMMTNIIFEAEIINNNNENVNINSKNFSILKENSRYKFIEALLENKKDIPNFRFEQTGNCLEAIEEFKNIYNTGKHLNYFTKVKYRIKQLPVILKILAVLGLICMLVLAVFYVIL